MKYKIVVILILFLALSSALARVETGDPKREDVLLGTRTNAFFGGNVVESINFDFVDGKRTYKDKRLLGILGFKKGDKIDAMSARFSKENLEKFYREEGFVFAQLALKSEQLPGNKLKLIYEIDEGPRVKIGKVLFNGNDAIKDRALKNALKTTKKRWLIWPKYYTEEVVTEDLWALKDVYWERGFLNSSVTVEKKFTHDRSRINIAFTINEGPVYTVEKILLKFVDAQGKTVEKIVLKPAKLQNEQNRTGEKPFDKKQLLAQVKLEPTQFYNERRAKSDAKQLRRLYREKGFVDAEVELLSPVFIPDATAVNVEFKIFEGQQYRIGWIDITGNTETQDKVIRRVLDEYSFQPGQWYNADIAPKQDTGELAKKVQSMTYAEEVTITPLASDEPGQKNVEVHIEEGQTRWGMLGADISFDRGLFGRLEFREENFNIHDKPESLEEFFSGKGFKGAGQKLRIMLRPGLRESMYSVSFREPYLKDKPISLDVTGSSWERENYKERYGFGEKRTKGFFSIGKWPKEKWGRSIRFRLENVDVGDFSSAPPGELTDIEGDNIIGGIGFDIGKRSTDGGYKPSKGYDFKTGYEQFSLDHTFGIWSTTLVNYRTIHEDLAERKTLLATKLLASTVVGDAPAFEKFYAGGTGIYGIRGFRYRGISTRAGINNDPVGSDWIFLANAEVTVPVVGESLSALFFVDSGAIDSGGYRMAIGSGVELQIPWLMGPVPMRFEFGVPVMKDDDDKTGIFTFSVGMQF